jgi:predicted NUDIX family phosphoesterase
MKDPRGPLIWGIPTAVIKPLLTDRQFYTGSVGDAILDDLRILGDWRHRNEVEEDPSFLQAIPYVVASNLDTGKFLLMRRMPKQTEVRLHGKRYVGVGGHIEQEDTTPGGDVIEAAAWREIKEETGWESGTLEFVGVVGAFGADLPPVNHVHIGVVYHLRTHETKFSGPEAADHEHSWATRDDLRGAYPDMELWAQIVCRDYLNLAL